MNIIVNGKEVTFEGGKTITYMQAVLLAKLPLGRLYTITYESEPWAGSLLPGKPVLVRPRMILSVADTGAA